MCMPIASVKQRQTQWSEAVSKGLDHARVPQTQRQRFRALQMDGWMDGWMDG